MKAQYHALHRNIYRHDMPMSESNFHASQLPYAVVFPGKISTIFFSQQNFLTENDYIVKFPPQL